MTTTATRTFPAHALKGGDVLTDGRNVFDTQAINRRQLLVRATDDLGNLSTFRAMVDQPIEVV